MYWWARPFNCRVLAHPALELLLTVTSGSGRADVRGIRLDEPVTVYGVARQLPTIADLRELCRSLAMLDAILSPDWESRYY